MKPAHRESTTAFNVERLRQRMLESVDLPNDFLQKAVMKVYKKLDARETKFFTFRGEIVEEVEVQDHATQLAAADKIMQMAGVYARERDAVPAAPTVALEMDPVTGVVRLIVGSPIAMLEAPTSLPNPGPSESDDSNLVPQALVASFSPPEEAQLCAAAPEPVEQEPQVIRVKRGRLPIGVYNALFGEGNA